MFTNWNDKPDTSHAFELLGNMEIFASIGGASSQGIHVVRVHIIKSKHTSSSLHNSLYRGSLPDAKQYAESVARALVQMLETIHPTTMEEGL